VMACVGLLGAALALVVTIAAQLRANAGASFENGMAWGIPAIVIVAVACIGMVCSLVAIVLGSIATVRAERHGRRPHWSAQIGGVSGTLGLGFGLGICMALYVLYYKIDAGAVAHTTKLKFMAYVIMAAMLGLIVVGLGWCFYRAIKAAGGAVPPTPQPAEEMNES